MFYWMKSSILLMVGGLSNMGEWRRLWAGKFEFVFRSTAPTYTLIYNQSTCWLEHLHDLPDSHVLPWCAVVVVVLLKSMNLEDISSTKRYSVIQQTYHERHLSTTTWILIVTIWLRPVSRKTGKAFTTGEWAVVSSSWLLLCITSLIPGKRI